jgi:hypothetical protein
VPSGKVDAIGIREKLPPITRCAASISCLANHLGGLAPS